MAAADVTIEMTSNGSSDGEQPKSMMDVASKGGVTKTIADYQKICAVHKDKDAGDDATDLVAFAAVEYICSESEPEVELTVARRGPGTQALTIAWTSDNGTIGEGSYHYQEGTITFEPGQMKTPLMLKVFDNPNWSTEGLQFIMLTKPAEDDTTATWVAGELWRTSVVILNDDPFPQGVEDPEDQAATIKGFIAHFLHALKKESNWGFLYMLYPGINFIVNQIIILNLMNMFKATNDGTACGSDDDTCVMVDGTSYSTAPTTDQAGGKTVLYMCAFFYVVNFALNHWFNRKFRHLKLGGKAMKNMRENMMTTMLSFSPHSQEHFPTGKVSKIMESQVENAVATTWAAVFKLEGALFQLMFQTLFMIYLQWGLPGLEPTGYSKCVVDCADGDDDDCTCDFVPPLIVTCIPIAMIVFDTFLLKLYIKAQSELSIQVMDKADAWSSFLIESANLRPLITTFRRGYAVALEFQGLHKEFNGKNFKANMFEAGTLWKAKWFPTLLAVFFIYYGGGNLLKLAPADRNVGTFVAAYNTTNAYGGTLGNIFAAVFAMGEGYASIKKMASLLNAETKRQQLKKAAIRRAGLVKEFVEKHGEMPDENNIFIDGVTFKYDEARPSSIPAISLEVEAGQLVAVSGPAAFGKTTFMQLMARIFIPSTGMILYPTRWRVRFADVPRLFDRDLMYNLKFGNQCEHPEEEIWALCEQVGLSSELMGQGGVDVGTMGEKLALSDRVCISIIRTLLSSVDLLLLANSLDALGEAHALKVMGVFQELIHHRGLPVLKTEMARTPPHLKKKKTIFISTKLPILEHECDSTIFLKPIAGSAPIAGENAFTHKDESGASAMA